jgi:hypothetical protein
MQLKPTVVAYFRVMAAHMVGRIQPPPVSPLAEATAPPPPEPVPADGSSNGRIQPLATPSP